MKHRLRLSFVARIAILFIFSLLALQFLTVMGFFIQRGSDTGTGFRLPLPDQIAALVELLETSPASQHSAILRAANGANVHARLETAPAAPPGGDWRPSPMVERVLRRYLPALGDRQVTVLLRREEGPWFPRVLRFVSPATLSIIVSLATGNALVVEVGGPLGTTLFGFPPGFWAGFLGFAMAIIAILVIRREVRPLRRLAEAADSLDLGEPRAIADFPSSAPEIRAVISAFNRMQERIGSLVRTRMAIIGGFSHDVRTFATRLRLRAELIPDEVERARATRDIEDMISLLDDALYAIQDRVPEESQELVDLPALLREEVEDRRKSGTRASIDVAAAAEGASVLGSAVALRRLFANLLENAIAYGGAARVSAAVSAGNVIVDIDDNGPGIPPELRKSVLQAFVRLEASRSRKTGGAGLGLAIASRVAESHGGTLRIDDAPGGGARIRVTLPLL
jgi:signal transduction histidine kinase